MPGVDLDKLLNEPIWAWDFRIMLSDVLDFVEFSELSISWQHRREQSMLERQAQIEQMEDRLREHHLENINYRFRVTLPRRVRYSGLAAFVTTLEWAAVILAKRATSPIPKKPKRVNETVHIYRTFNDRGQLGLDAKFAELEQLIQVRNCTSHAAGLLEQYKHDAGLRQVLAALPGFRVSDNDFVGVSVEILPGAIEARLNDALDWLPRFHEACSAKRLIKV